MRCWLHPLNLAWLLSEFKVCLLVPTAADAGVDAADAKAADADADAGAVHIVPCGFQNPSCGNTDPGTTPPVPFTCDNDTSEYDSSKDDSRPPSQTTCCKVRTAAAWPVGPAMSRPGGGPKHVVHAASAAANTL